MSKINYFDLSEEYSKMFREALKHNVARSEYKEKEKDDAGLISMQSQREKTIEKWDQLMPSLKGDFKSIITSTPKTKVMSEDIYAKNRLKLVELITEKGFTINEERSSDDFLYFNLGGYNYGLEIFTDEDQIRYFIDDIDNVNLEEYFYDDYDWTGDLKEFKNFLFDSMCFKWKYIKTMYDEYVTLRNKHKNHPDDGVFDKILNNIYYDVDDED